MHGFHKAAEYLRNRFLVSAAKKLQESGSAAARNTTSDAKAQQATQIMRRWEIALPGEQRKKAYQAAVTFLTGDPPIDEVQEKAAQKRGQAFRNLLNTGQESNDCAKRDILAVTTLYADKTDQCLLINSTWQTIDVDTDEFKAKAKLAKLVMIDPFYPDEYQPKETEWSYEEDIGLLLHHWHSCPSIWKTTDTVC